MDKPSLRQKHLNHRKTLSAEDHQRFSALIFRHALVELELYEHIGIYISMPHEVDTRQMMDWCFKHNKHVYVPKILKEGMIFVEIKSLEECLMNRMGILEPISNIAYDTIELMLVPMLAFNERKHRLGYGKAYYDRYLSKHAVLKVGLCYQGDFEVELVESTTDVQMDKIITENGLFKL